MLDFVKSDQELGFTEVAKLRQSAIKEMHAICNEASVRFRMTNHFIHRINLRSTNQANAFCTMIVAVRKMLQHATPGNKTSIRVNNDIFLMVLDPKPPMRGYEASHPREINCISYSYVGGCDVDRHFKDVTDQLRYVRKAS